MNPYHIMHITKEQLDSNRHIYAITRHAVRIVLYESGHSIQDIADMEGIVAHRAVAYSTIRYSIEDAKRDKILIREITRVRRRIRDYQRLQSLTTINQPQWSARPNP